MIQNIQLATEFMTNNPMLLATIATIVAGLTEITKDLVKPFSDFLEKNDQIYKVIAVVYSVLLFSFELPILVYVGLIAGLVTTYSYKIAKVAKKVNK